MRITLLAAAAAAIVASPAVAQILDGPAGTAAPVGAGIAAAAGTPSIVGDATRAAGETGEQTAAGGAARPAPAPVRVAPGTRCTDGATAYDPTPGADGGYRCEPRGAGARPR